MNRPRGYDDKIAKIANLPKWVQRYIAKLERDLGNAMVVQQAIDEGTTDIHWFQGWKDSEHYLPSSCTICLGKPPHQIEICLRNGAVEVRSDRTLLINPQASNAIKLTSE